MSRVGHWRVCEVHRVNAEITVKLARTSPNSAIRIRRAHSFHLVHANYPLQLIQRRHIAEVFSSIIKRAFTDLIHSPRDIWNKGNEKSFF